MNLIDVFYNAIDVLGNIWNYTLVVVDRQPIAISNLVTALTLFLIVLRIARKVSATVNAKISLLFPLDKNISDKNIATAVERIVYYLFLAFATFIVLQITNIPVTAFTFVGGALAIGLGFASQHIINNFISGLIIMIEQPIRMGDVVKYDKILGVVTNIGSRCTHILTYDNYELILPNSTLLQNTIINFTLSSNGILRTTLNISVSVDNDPEQVTNIISDVFKHIEGLVEDKEIEIGLSAFEIQEMKFQISFWYYMNGPVSKDVMVHNALTAMHVKFRASKIKFPEYSTFAH